MSKLSINHRGFSLLETMIALAIIIFGILIMVKIFPLAFKISHLAEQATMATDLGQAEVEQVFSLGYDNIPLGTIEAKHRLAAASSDPLYYFQRQTTSEYVDGNLNTSATDTGLKKISVITYWYNPILRLEKNIQIILLISQK